LLQSARQRWASVKSHPAVAETLALLLALGLACIAGLAQRAGKWVRAGRPGSVSWRSVGDRCLFAATVTLLAVSAVVAILVAVVVILGRTEPGPESVPLPAQIRMARPVVPARSSETAETSDPIAGLIDRVSSSSDSSEVAAEPPVEAAAQDSAPQPTEDDGAATEIPAVTPRHDL